MRFVVKTRPWAGQDCPGCHAINDFAFKKTFGPAENRVASISDGLPIATSEFRFIRRVDNGAEFK
jgi:hypothetical protein